MIITLISHRPSLPAPRPPLVEQLQSQSLLLEKKLLFLGDKELPGKKFFNDISPVLATCAGSFSSSLKVWI